MRFIIDLAIPIVLLLAGVAGKWLMAGKGWEWEFGCLSPDLLLGGFGAELAFLCDLGKKYLAVGSPPIPQADAKRLIFDAAFIVVTVVMLAFSWIAHRLPHTPEGERQVPRSWNRWMKLWLVGFWNVLGIALLLGFLLLIKVD